MEINEKVKKALGGCKTATVMLWISCGGSAFTGAIGLFGSLATGNVATLLTVALAGGMAFLSGWMAKSINTAVRYIEGENGDDEPGEKDESENENQKNDLED